MSNKGTNAREEPRQEEKEESTEIPFLADLFSENGDSDLHEILRNHFKSPNPPLPTSSHQLEGPSNTSMAHFTPPSGGELENASETQEPNLFMEPALNQSRNVDQEPNYAGLPKVSVPTAQGNVPVMEPNSQSQVVSGIAAPSQSVPATQDANNNNLQPQKSQVSTDRGKKVAKGKDKAKCEGLLKQHYPLAMALNTQNQPQSIGPYALLGTNPTRKQLRIGDSSSSPSSSRNVKMKTTLLENNQQSTPIRVGNTTPSNVHGSPQQFASTEMENPPAPLLNNNQQLASVQVGNLQNPFSLPDNGRQMALGGADSFINQPNLRNNSQQLAPIGMENPPRQLLNNNQQVAPNGMENPATHLLNNNQQVAPMGMENPPTHLLNNGQQMAFHHFGNFLNPSPMNDNGERVVLPRVDNSPALANNNQQLAPVGVDNLHYQPAQGSENPPPPPRENGLYGQVYEQMGFHADYTLRMFFASKHNRGGM